MRAFFILGMYLCIISVCKATKPTEIQTLSLKAEVVEIAQILNPRDLVCTENYLVVRNSLENGIFSFYALPDLDYKTSWGRMGKGPGEYRAPCMTSAEKDRLLIADFAVFSMTEKNVENQVIATYTLPSDIPLFNDIHLASDSLFCFPVREKGKTLIEVRELGTGKIKEKIDLTTSAQSLNDDGTLAVCKGAFAYAYCFQNKLWIKKQGAEAGTWVGSGERDAKNEIYYYSNVKATPRFVYALFQGYKENEITPDARDKFSRILVYDWEGKLLKELKVDRIVNLIAISPDEKNIYAFSPFDPEHILKYQF